jgi:hypothetical protein
MTYYGLRISEYRACTLCLGTETPAPVTGAAADEYNLNVVDCNASVTVARPAVLNLSQWGSGGYRDPQPPEANVKDVYEFPWPPPGLLGILRKTQFLRYYSSELSLKGLVEERERERESLATLRKSMCESMC